jgi:hypothetical protein
MKKFLKTNALPFLGVFLISLTSACVKKNPGPGGTSAIKGKITGKEFKPGGLEVQQITFTPGSQIEHGDYFLLNKVTANNNYYIYFKNPNWVSDADPDLQGRIGLEVIFNYSDSNIEIAQAVKNKLASLGVLQFTMYLTQDIHTLTYKSRENINDPDNGTTQFAMDVVQQGSADYTSSMVVSMAEQHVYLCYGDDPYPSDEVKTNNSGDFIFKNLQIGTYKVYVIGQLPPIANQHEEISANVTITEKNSIHDLGSLQIYF